MIEILENTIKPFELKARLERNQKISIPRWWFGMGTGEEEYTCTVSVCGTVDVYTGDERGAIFGGLREEGAKYGDVLFWGHRLFVVKVRGKWEVVRRYSKTTVVL